MKQLPRSLDEIGGLRVARWIRESTSGQFDRYGPASQREQQDRFIERNGLVDTGLVFQVAHSGTTVWRSATMNEMLASANAGAFDLLLAGYSDRWQRNLRRTLELLEDGLHPSGAALVLCDRRILSSDPRDWDELVAESAGAERYSRRLSERITDGYAAKFELRSDPGGHAALGFRRSADPPHTLEVDPVTIGTAVGLFERYALGTVSSERLAEETGLAASRIRCILMNPLYNGWVRRGRGRAAVRRPAPWRAVPPVSDGLWARVEDVRRSKSRGGGTRNRGRVDLLGGLLECVCGRRIRSDGTFADGRHRKLHTEPCEAWADTLVSPTRRGSQRSSSSWPVCSSMSRRSGRWWRHSCRRSVRSRLSEAGPIDSCGSLPSTTRPAIWTTRPIWREQPRCVPSVTHLRRMIQAFRRNVPSPGSGRLARPY